MKKVYHLGTCSTGKKIFKSLPMGNDFDYQEIKENNIKPDQLDELKEITGSYDALFSRRAMKYREWGLNEKELSEKEIRDLILKEYTFLKRPVFVIDGKVFAGSAPKTIEEVKQAILQSRKKS